VGVCRRTTDDFESQQAARAHLSEWYDEEVWTQQPTADIDLTFDVDNDSVGGVIGGDAFSALTIECESECTYYDDYTATATVRCRFDRESEQVTFEEAMIQLEPAA
jgi:hypothetical protein